MSEVIFIMSWYFLNRYLTQICQKMIKNISGFIFSVVFRFPRNDRIKPISTHSALLGGGGLEISGKIDDVVYGWTLIALIICLALTTSTGQRCNSLLRLKKFHCSAKNLKQESIIFAIFIVSSECYFA